MKVLPVTVSRSETLSGYRHLPTAPSHTTTLIFSLRFFWKPGSNYQYWRNMKLNRFLHRLILLVAVYIFSSTWVPVEGSTNPGTDFLNKKEAEVTLLKKNLEGNYRQQCELMRTCGAPTTCARNSCAPLRGDVDHLTCQEVKNNTYCTASTGTCTSKNFDYTKSYVRVAPTTDITSTVTAATICSQRELDPLFKTLCSESSLSRAFVGTVDGTYIHFPGSDQSKEDCGKYDPRNRPWYRTSTSVAKAVMVLVDAGEFMGSTLALPLEGTVLKVTQGIIKELLNTLSEGDYINIIAFDSSKATSLAPLPVRVEYYKTGNSTYHPEFDGLKGNLSSITVENSGQKPSNISLGITEALANFAPDGVPSYKTSIKIIIAFTDGNSATLKDGALAELVGKNLKVFIFKLPQNKEDTANRFLPGSPFLDELRSINGSFNVITWEAKNPLFAIQPYFSLLANFRASINDSADYSPIYEDYENVVDNIFSITKPAFADDGKLLGIVGLNIFLDKLGSDTESVKNALSQRNQEKAFDPSKFVLTASNASIQTENNPTQLCEWSIPIPSNGGLCAQTDTESTIQDLACCDACILRGASHTHTNSKLKNIGIGVGAAGFVVVVILVSLAVRLFLLRWRHQHIVKRDYPDFPADPEYRPPDQHAPTTLHQTGVN